MRSLHNELLGPIEIVFRRNSSRISARWKNGIALFSFPATIDHHEIPQYIDRMAPALLSRRREVSFKENQEIKLEGFSFILSRQNHQPQSIWATIKGDTAYIEIGLSLSIDRLEVKQAISKTMCNIARKVAERVLLPRARDIAATLGARPRAWAIMDGFKTMGKCSSRGDVYLSYMCLFLPQELRDYIVCHELAHLKEMSHSARFHAICDAYCGGKEKELIRKLNEYHWPVLRR